MATFFRQTEGKVDDGYLLWEIKLKNDRTNILTTDEKLKREFIFSSFLNPAK